MNKVRIIVLLMTVTVLISSAIGATNQTVSKHITYRVAIDQFHGFYRIYYANTSGMTVQIPYNGTLTINKGDTITWMNDAVPDARLTVMSKQKLWNDSAGTMKWAYKQFSYTFNNSGTFDIYVKEYSKFKQKIIVGPITNNKKLNSTNAIRPISTSNSSKTNLSKNNSQKVNRTNVSNTNYLKNNSPKNKTNVSSADYLKNNSPKNKTNISANASEKNMMNSLESLGTLPTMMIISIASIIYIIRRRRTHE